VRRTPPVQPGGRERMKDNLFCADEAAASYKCLDQHPDDRDKCSEFFRAYKECKRRWVRRGAARCTRPLVGIRAHPAWAGGAERPAERGARGGAPQDVLRPVKATAPARSVSAGRCVHAG